MKKIIIVIILITVFGGNVFGQMTQYFQAGMTPEQADRAYRDYVRSEGSKKSFFGRVDQPWLDGVLMRVLQYFDGIHWYFSKMEVGNVYKKKVGCNNLNMYYF